MKQKRGTRRTRIFRHGLWWLCAMPTLVLAAQLKPFTTDGCSSFPDGTRAQQSLWINCCIRHDYAYWKGGTQAQRLAADKALQSCVAQVGEPEIAALMLAGVRVGGSPYWPTSFRWGYGWPYPRGYQSLSQEEEVQVREQFEAFKLLLNTLAGEFTVSREHGKK